MALRIMENEFLRVTVDDHGAELVSVYDKETGLERIWNADPRVWNRHAPILFPFVGKVNQGLYRHEGKVYEMKTQHGFARDREFACVSAEEDCMVHCLKADESTMAVYPFSFELYVTHRFAQDNGRLLEVQWQVYNCGSNDMYYSIGGHPGFTVPAYENESRDQYFLEFPGKEELQYLLLNQKTGLAVPDVSFPLTLDNGYCPIAADMFDRDALVFEHGQVETVRIAAPDKSPYITLNCAGFPYVGIWSKPEGRFVCLEPWVGRTDNDGFDGELKDKAGEWMLPAGESKILTYSVEFH